MRMKGFLVTTLAVFFLLSVGLATSAQAGAAYPEPNKVIEFLHHSSPGGAAGLFVLTTGDLLNKTGLVKAKIQTQTRQGGSSAVALNYLRSHKGDPYVVMHWTTAQIMAMLRKTTEMKLDEPVYLSTLIQDGNVLIVPANSPYKNLKELIEDARKNPKKINVGINSVGGSEDVMSSRIQRAAGVKFNVTSFDFSPTALIAGNVDMAFGSVAETQGLVKGGRARVLANMGTIRVPYYKDIPTCVEQGINASFTQYRGFFGAPGFPPEAYKFWDETFAKLMKTKEYQAFIDKFDVVADYKDAATTKAFVADYIKGLEEDLKFIDVK